MSDRDWQAFEVALRNALAGNKPAAGSDDSKKQMQ
jgi:hypothetical protein